MQLRILQTWQAAHRGSMHKYPSTSQRDVARPGRQRRPGRRAADRSRHDARPDRRSARSTASKFDGVDLFLFDPHVSIDSTDDDLKRLADKVRAQGPRRRLGRRAGLAADRRRLGDGRATRSARSSSTQVRKACRDRAEAARARHPPVRRRPHRLGGEPGRLGEGSRRATRRRSPRRSARPCDVAEDFGERLAAEGEICWGGMHSWKRKVELLEMVDRPEDARLPGRHGAHAALHAGLQRARGSHPARGLRLEGPDDARRGAEDADARAAALDDRLPRRAERRARSKAPARTTRPAATACRTIRTASSTSSQHAGYWLRDDERQADAARSSTSAGTAACSRTRR